MRKKSSIYPSAINAKEPRPWIFDPSRRTQQKILIKLQKDKHVIVINKLRDQLNELFAVTHPNLKTHPDLLQKELQHYVKQLKHQRNVRDRWVYYPWSYSLVHILASQQFAKLRTARNRNLITESEQKILSKARIGIAGLSVGNSAALTLALEGVSYFALTDADKVSLSNLNRLRAGLKNLDQNKTTVTAQQIYEINPFVHLRLFTNGLNSKNLKKFANSFKGLQLIVDEMDDVIMKLELRKLAKKLHIPVISAADNGPNSIVDVERYDIEPNRQIYHGALGDLKNIKPKSVLDFDKRLGLINKMVGMRYVTKRMKNSLKQIGKTLWAWPQLASAASLSGSAITYCAKQILFGKLLKSGKYYLDLNKAFKVKDND